MGQGRKPLPFPKGKRTKAELEARKGPGYTVAIGAKPPAHLNAHGKAEWRRVVPELERLGIIKGVSVGSIVGLCSSFGTAMEAERSIKRHGLTIQIPIISLRTGETVGHRIETNPAIKIAREAWTTYRSYAGECCVTPASENKAPKTGGEQPVDELEIALCG